jgi:hypothetical protein
VARRDILVHRAMTRLEGGHFQTRSEPLPHDHVLLPWHAQGHPRTGLNRKCRAVCTWVARIRHRDIRAIAGVVPGQSCWRSWLSYFGDKRDYHSLPEESDLLRFWALAANAKGRLDIAPEELEGRNQRSALVKTMFLYAVANANISRVHITCTRTARSVWL